MGFIDTLNPEQMLWIFFYKLQVYKHPKYTTSMKICVAQIRPFKGNIEKNITSHLELIQFAAREQVSALFFPELSITGYEPELAKSLETNQNDKRFDVFQKMSDLNNITIGIGVPTVGVLKPLVSMVIFQPNKDRLTYSKQYLYKGEEQYFENGNTPCFIQINNHKIAPAICYESSVSEHSDAAISQSATIYIASVMTNLSGIQKKLSVLSGLAKKHRIIVLMSNFVGVSGGSQSAGKTSIWNQKGKLKGQMNSKDEGLLIYDTDTGIVDEKLKN